MDRLVGIPYVPHGRDYDGADCWGIAFLFHRDVLGRPIPDYSAEMHRRRFDRRAIGPLIEAERAEHWREVDRPGFGTMVLMRCGRHETHVGVHLGRGRMLHSEGPGASEIVRLDDLRIASRIVGFFEREPPC